MTCTPPSNEIPARIAVKTPLAVTTEAALWIGAVSVYSNCLGFTVHAEFKEPRQSEPVYLSSYVDPLTIPSLYLTAVYADGRFAANMVDFRQEPRDSTQPLLLCRSSQGASNSASADYELSPVPSEGQLTLSFAVPTLGVGEVRVVIAGSDLTAASERIVTLWT